MTTLAAEGMAQQMTIAPNVRWATLFHMLVAAAKQDERGLWQYAQEEVITTTPAAENSGSTGKVTIVSVDYRGEIVVIRNDDLVDIDLTGWKLVSVRGNQQYHFPDNFILKSGQSVQIVSGLTAAAGEGKLFWTTANVHNNNEDDPAELYDASGNKVSEFK